MKRARENEKGLEENYKHFGIMTRPSASNGLWLSILIPLAYMVNTWNSSKSVNFDYKISTIISLGLLLQSIASYITLKQKKPNKFVDSVCQTLPAIATSFLIWICLKQNIIFSCSSGFSTTQFYRFLCIYILKSLPKSFTIGEVSVVAQGSTIFFYNVCIQLPNTLMSENDSLSTMMKVNSVLQIGLIGVIILLTIVHLIKFMRLKFPFYIMLVTVVYLVAICPVAGTLAVVILYEFISSDFERIFVTLVFMLHILVTAVVVLWKINSKKASTTSTRKIFHILIGIVYLSGLMFQCSLIYIASVIMLAIFIVLETARVIKLEPFYKGLEVAVNTFIDEKDAGYVALTPIYLLIGCSIPIWLHPSPCDLTDSAGQELLLLLSGVLSVSIGDTAASTIGYSLGRHKWPGSKKSVEGTIASIVAQCLFVTLLHLSGQVILNKLKIATVCAAIITNSVVEAKTDQVDNLILPLVTFVIIGTI